MNGWMNEFVIICIPIANSSLVCSYIWVLNTIVWNLSMKSSLRVWTLCISTNADYGPKGFNLFALNPPFSPNSVAMSACAWWSQTAYRCRFPNWADKPVAGSAPHLQSHQWCWALVTGSVLFHDEYVNVNGCSFSLGVTLARSLICWWFLCRFHERNGLKINLESCIGMQWKCSPSVFDKWKRSCLFSLLSTCLSSGIIFF